MSDGVHPHGKCLEVYAQIIADAVQQAEASLVYSIWPRNTSSKCQILFDNRCYPGLLCQVAGKILNIIKRQRTPA